MLHILQTALELGFLYALVPMALFLSFRILDIADMTTDGCFVLGTAVSVTMAAAGHPFLAVPAAMLAGICAGFVTAFQQTRLGVPSILAGIITKALLPSLCPLKAPTKLGSLTCLYRFPTNVRRARCDEAIS